MHPPTVGYLGGPPIERRDVTRIRVHSSAICVHSTCTPYMHVYIYMYIYIHWVMTHNVILFMRIYFAPLPPPTPRD